MDTNTAKIGRLPFFDFLKMFAMFMVLWGHCRTLHPASSNRRGLGRADA